MFLAPRLFIDQVRRSEAETLVAIHGEAFARPWSADDFTALVADRSVYALALRRESLFGNRRMQGFVLVRAAADEAEILTIAVAPSAQGKGYGRRLMEDIMRRLYADGVRSLFLEVDGANAPAVRLYRSLGFETVGERKGYYHRADGSTGTALVMRVQLR
ncbi:MAG: ribosomal protein S18-alanine N-acetyltransferase [Rhizobiales bacterium]|nr:ribosomal protein S18-alanine N-acetyltransferase [Hyphomicrobiales bacterium]MBN9010371.1 ribosomal protein S18-alanine N-acetyltransferase [Hyphomicrobiales bacterium]